MVEQKRIGHDIKQDGGSYKDAFFVLFIFGDEPDDKQNNYPNQRIDKEKQYFGQDEIHISKIVNFMVTGWDFNHKGH